MTIPAWAIAFWVCLNIVALSWVVWLVLGQAQEMFLGSLDEKLNKGDLKMECPNCKKSSMLADPTAGEAVLFMRIFDREHAKCAKKGE